MVSFALVLAAALLIGAAPLATGWLWTLPQGWSAPPVPVDNAMTVARVELGHRLFYDADLSLDGTMACATCHEQKHGFADGNATHPGVTGQAGRRNVPGLANVAWLTPLTHADPRQSTLEAQALVPLLGTHPVEMGMKDHEGEFARRLGRDPCYRQMFAAAFPASGGRIDLASVTEALASFERTLVSTSSAWDRGTLPVAARRGEVVFGKACAACHAGPNLTDARFHRLEPVSPGAPDQGLFEVTGREADRAAFRTPSLRNVALTGPWWHDGSAASLPEAIARHGIALTPAAQGQVIAFLEALSDPAFIANPATRLPVEACGHKL